MRETGKNWLRQWTRFVTGNAILVVLATAVVTALLANFTVRNLGISTDTENMIAETVAWRQDFIGYRTMFPDLYRNIIVVVTADTESTAQSAAEHLSQLLDEMPEHVTSHYSATVDEPLAGNELLFLETDELEDLADNLASAQPFFGRLRTDLSLTALFELLGTAASRNQLASADRLLTNIGSIISATLAGDDSVLDWSSASAGEARTPRRLLFVKPVLNPELPRAARPALEALAAAAAQTRVVYDSRVRINLTGLVALEDEELVNVASNAKTTGLLALASVMIVLMFAFRSMRLLFISIVTLLAGLTGTAAFAAWSVQNLNIISVAFGVLYIGLGIDFIIHYLLRLREASARGVSIDKALQAAAEDVGGSIFICAITTAAGFYAFIPTSFTGVSQLGLVSGTGMFISFVATMTILPALIRLSFPNGLHVTDTAASWAPGRRLSKLLVYRRTIIAIPVVLAVATLFNLEQVRFESDPMLLRDPAMESVKTFRELSDDPDTTPAAISIVLEPGQDVDATTRALESLPSVEGAISLRRFATDSQDDELAIIDDLSLLLGPSFDRFPQPKHIDVTATTAAITGLRDALHAGREQQRGPAQALGKSLAQLESSLSGMTGDRQLELLRRLQANLLGDLPAAMKLLATRLQPRPLSPAEFPRSFVSRWQTPDGAQLVQVIPAEDISNPAHADAFVTDVLSVAPRATGLPIVYHKSGDTVIGAFSQAFISAFLVIAILLLVLFRSGYDTVLVLAPLATAALLLTGFMVSIDLPFNFANIIALPLLLGISVDTGIHLVHRARQSQADRVRLLETSTSRAILFSTVTTLASFGNLALSTHLGMASMGILLGSGLVIILLIMILVLPVLLTLEKR